MSFAVGAEQYVEEHVQGHVKVFLFLYIYKIIFSFCVTLDFFLLLCNSLEANPSPAKSAIGVRN